MRLIIIGLISLFASTANAGIFGPSDAVECMEKYASRVRLVDAMNVLRPACVIGYEDNMGYNPDMIKASKCIAKESGDMYSHESTRRVINNCSRKAPEVYAFYERKLMKNVNAAAEQSAREYRYRQDQMEQQIKDAQNGPVTIYDPNTGTNKNCYRTGPYVSCY